MPAGWKVSDATQLSYGQALLTKSAPEGGQPPNDTSVLLGRLDMKLFAGAETDNAKAAQRLASDMGEFFMPFPGTRVNQENGALDAAGMPGVASYYEVKFTDTNKPTGQIWAGVVGEPSGARRTARRSAPRRWFVVWLGTANNPVDKGEAVTLANSIRPFAPPPPPAPAPVDPNAPPHHRRIPMRHRRIRTHRRRGRASEWPCRSHRMPRRGCCLPPDGGTALARRGSNPKT